MSSSQEKFRQRKCAAIVCGHVAAGDRPILLAERSEPEEPADSGWQFLCGVEGEDWNEAKVWSVQEVIEIDSSLTDLVDLPAGTRLARAEVSSRWETVPAEAKRQ